MAPAGQNEMEEGTGSSGPPTGPSLGQAGFVGMKGQPNPNLDRKPRKPSGLARAPPIGPAGKRLEPRRRA